MGDAAATRLTSPDACSVARRVVTEYYDAIQRHSAEGMLKCVSEEIACTFLEPERNWLGKEVAAKKFSDWFRRCPDVSVQWEITSIAPTTACDGVATSENGC